MELLIKIILIIYTLFCYFITKFAISNAPVPITHVVAYKIVMFIVFILSPISLPLLLILSLFVKEKNHD